MTELNSFWVPVVMLMWVMTTPMPSGSRRIRSSMLPGRSVGLMIPTDPRQFSNAMIFPSPAGDAVDALAGARHRVLAPALAAVLGAEHLRLTRGVEHHIGIVRMEVDRHHGALRLDPMIEALPGGARVGAAADRAGIALGRHAQAGIERRRILRRDADVSAIGQ